MNEIILYLVIFSKTFFLKCLIKSITFHVIDCRQKKLSSLLKIIFSLHNYGEILMNILKVAIIIIYIFNSQLQIEILFSEKTSKVTVSVSDHAETIIMIIIIYNYNNIYNYTKRCL